MIINKNSINFLKYCQGSISHILFTNNVLQFYYMIFVIFCVTNSLSWIMRKFPETVHESSVHSRRGHAVNDPGKGIKSNDHVATLYRTAQWNRAVCSLLHTAITVTAMLHDLHGLLSRARTSCLQKRIKTLSWHGRFL